MNDASPFFLSCISNEMVETFATLVSSADGDGAAQMVEQLLASGVSAETLMLDLFAPAARRMGEFWTEDRCDFLEVTVALSRLQQLIRQFRVPTSAQRHLDGHALLVAVPGEQHTFGVRLVEEYLLRAGWQVTAVLKASEPDIARLVASDVYDFVGFSLTSERLLPALRSAIRCVRTSSRNQGVKIAVGGVLLAGRDFDPSDIDTDAIVTDAHEAVAVANEWAGMMGVD